MSDGGSNKRTSMNQSLFQVNYLGQTQVDRRCAAAVIPWIIEELKLKVGSPQKTKLIWLTPGALFIVLNKHEHIQPSQFSAAVCMCVHACMHGHTWMHVGMISFFFQVVEFKPHVCLCVCVCVCVLVEKSKKTLQFHDTFPN